MANGKIIPKVTNILIYFPTNVGDTILGLPVLDKIKANYPKAKITAIASSQTQDFLLRNNFIDEVVLFDKHWRGSKKIRFCRSLKGKYNLTVDLKNSFLPVILGVKSRTPFLRFFPKNMHIKDKYLSLIERFTEEKVAPRSETILTEDEKNKWMSLIPAPALFIACSSLTFIKSYPYEYLKKTVSVLGEKYPLVVLGNEKDRKFYKDILSFEGIVDLVGKTQMIDVFYILKNYARLLLAVDSSILHLGSYLNVPIVAFFGPTHPDRSYPYSEKNVILRKELPCVPCEKSQCSFNNECMQITPREVIKAVDELWERSQKEY